MRKPWGPAELKSPDLTQPLFVRYCDDEACMNMTVLSRKCWDDRAHREYDDTADLDTVAILFHQSTPQVNYEQEDFGDGYAQLFAAAPKMLVLLNSIYKKVLPGRTVVDLDSAVIAELVGLVLQFEPFSKPTDPT